MGHTTPDDDRRQKWSAPRERLIVQLIHWGVVLIVALLVFVLGINHELDHASVTALYGTILGHAGTSASQKLSARASDSDRE